MLVSAPCGGNECFDIALVCFPSEQVVRFLRDSVKLCRVSGTSRAGSISGNSIGCSASGSTVLGTVHIRTGADLGAGTAVRDHVTIAPWVQTGMQACITKGVREEGITVGGVPARPLVEPPRWGAAQSAPIRSEKGDLTGHVMTIEDITERKRVEEAMRQAKEATEAAARAKGTLRLEGKEYIVKDGDIVHIRSSL